MFPTAARLSKASRAPLTPKRGNKDFYKGTRQAFLPGGPRTGAPGKHVVRGKAKYRLLDEKVRVFVAPPIEEIKACPLKPYVAVGTKLTADQEMAVWGKYRGPGGLTPEHFLRIAREHTYARLNPESPSTNKFERPSWMNAQIRLGILGNPLEKGIQVRRENPVDLGNGSGSGTGAAKSGPVLRELEIVESTPSAPVHST